LLISDFGLRIERMRFEILCSIAYFKSQNFKFEIRVFAFFDLKSAIRNPQFHL